MPPTRVTPRVGYRMRLNKDPVGMGEMFGKQSACTILVSCPPCARLPARNGLVNEVEFLGLIPQNGGRPMRLRDR